MPLWALISIPLLVFAWRFRAMSARGVCLSAAWINGPSHNGGRCGPLDTSLSEIQANLYMYERSTSHAVSCATRRKKINPGQQRNGMSSRIAVV